ncbi:MAG: hypothetical protein RIC55_25355 [Pirellulaceae bacterium]
MPENNDREHDRPLTRGEKLLVELKRSRILPGQFRMRSLLWGMVVCSVLLTAPRLLGWEYDRFFKFLWLMVFALAPVLALVGAVFYPQWKRSKRLLSAGACLLLAIVPLLLCIAWQGEAESIPGMLLATGIFFWLPQTLCIAAVWFFLFREPRR